MTQFAPFLLAAFAALTIITYVFLDGFGLGIGLLFPWARSPEDRAVMMAAIAPVWDGNQSFLVLGAMVLLTGFPGAVQVILPALFLPLLLMLFGLVLRGIAFEFRAYGASRLSGTYDKVFALGSVLMTFGQGAALGGFVQGLPTAVTAHGLVFAGGAWSWLSPFSLLTGVCLTFGYALLGSTWLIWRTEGAIQAFAKSMIPFNLVCAAAALLLVSGLSLIVVPTAAGRWLTFPQAFALVPIPLVSLAAIVGVARSMRRGAEHWPFAWALVLFACGFAGLVSLLWPFAVPYHLTVEQAASRPGTLALGGTALALGLPVVFTYLGFQYWVFRGKVHEAPEDH